MVARSAASEASATPSPPLSLRVQFVRGGARAALGLSKVYLSPADMGVLALAADATVAVFDHQSARLLLCGVVWPLDSIRRRGVGLSAMWERHVATESGVYVLPLATSGVAVAPLSSATLQVVARSGGRLPAAEKERALLSRYVAAMLDGVLLYTRALLSLSVHGVPTVFKVVAIGDDTTTTTSNRNNTSAGDEAAATKTLVHKMTRTASLRIKWEMPEAPIEDQLAALTLDSTEPHAAPTDLRSAPPRTTSAPLRGFASVGGLKAEIETIRQIIEQPLVNPGMFRQFGLPPPKGLLMFGPPGTGKTLIARALAAELRAKIFFINGPEVVSKFIGESEANLRRIFQSAARAGPSLIFIDEIDAICPKRDARVGDMEKRMVATLLTLMDGLEASAQVVVLAATNRPNALDPAVRRPGRFDREVEIAIPNALGRLDILRVALARLPHTVSDEQLQALSGSAHGYVGADLSALCKEAALLALQRAFGHRREQLVQQQPLGDAAVPAHALDASAQLPAFSVEIGDLQRAMRGVRPSALREIVIDVPRVLWSDIGGQHMIKQQLKEAVEWPLTHPEAFSAMNFIAIKGPELFSKWVGESEKAVHAVFRKARAAAPTVVFFDEIDAIASQRGGDGGSQVADRVLSQLLTELDGIEPLKQVLVVAATNRPDLIDSALLRPGRIDRVLYVGPPDLQARREILAIHCRHMPLAGDVDLHEFAIATAQFSGAELYALCREAAMAAIEESKRAEHVAARHFLRALRLIQPQIDAAMLAFFDDFRLSRTRK
ncbi:hypothetical protein PybrP1_006837 [[Pythium] brassicae (nom. inval.)]|nr:hypothetical protein PybrP1_006837 [[Pythium] brassicae (nom. inval.)]